jgi:hypothetical protein
VAAADPIEMEVAGDATATAAASAIGHLMGKTRKEKKKKR